MTEPPKRIWLVNLFFGVGVAPTGAFLESVAVALERAGWQVEVLTGDASYNKATTSQARSFGGTIHTFRTASGQVAGFGGRLLSWLLFYLRTAYFAFTHRLPAKILLMTTPPYMHLIFAVRNWFTRRKAELILWNQDTYPEVLAAVGIVGPKSLLYHFLLHLQSWGARRTDKVIVLDRAMQDILKRHGGKQVRIIPNWEIPLQAGNSPEDKALRECIRAAKAEFRFLVLYTGNYGWGHDLSTLAEYLRRHPHQRTFYFLFLGGGEKWRDLAALREEAGGADIGVFPYLPKLQMASLIGHADFGLVALEKSCVGLMSPSKIHGYLLCGKPLLYLGPEGSNVADAIAQFHCGLRIDEKDPAELERCLDAIANGVIDRAALGRNALKAAAERYSETVGVRDIVEFVTKDGPVGEPRG